MSGILTPEIIIYNTLEKIIAFIRSDLKKYNDELEKSWLYKLLGLDEDNVPIKMNRYKYFDQAKKVFESEQNLNVSFGYNPEVAKYLSLHIILPSEQTAVVTIGEDEGYQTEMINGMTQEKLSQSFNSTYQIMISGTNSSEINLVYNVLKSTLIALVPHLSLKGLLNPTISGNDIVFKDDIMPSGIFHRVLNITFMYELVVPQLLLKDLVKSVSFHGSAKDGD
nr:MAG TPA: Baseplate hub assembly protein [Caudoviricetes sp.]